MQVAILCGGMGTRLREETEFKPKPMVQIGDYPVLWHIMRYYRSFGHKDFLLCTGYRGDMIKDYFLNYRDQTQDVKVDLSSGHVQYLDDKDRAKEKLDWSVIIQDTGVHTLTGARLKAATEHIEDDLFLATYGDGLANVDIKALIDHHKASGRLATVTAVRPSSRFGELGLKGDLVQSFVEKPQTGEGWINGGFFVFNKKVFDRIGNNSDIPLEAGVLEDLAADQQLSVYRHEGFWQCMDTYRELCLLKDHWESDKAEWKVW